MYLTKKKGEDLRVCVSGIRSVYVCHCVCLYVCVCIIIIACVDNYLCA